MFISRCTSCGCPGCPNGYRHGYSSFNGGYCNGLGGSDLEAYLRSPYVSHWHESPLPNPTPTQQLPKAVSETTNGEAGPAPLDSKGPNDLS